MVSKTVIIVNIVLVCVFIAILAGSTYALGVETVDRESDGYETASTFTSISAIMTVISLLSLIILVSVFSGGITIASSKPGNYTVGLPAFNNYSQPQPQPQQQIPNYPTYYQPPVVM